MSAWGDIHPGDCLTFGENTPDAQRYGVVSLHGDDLELQEWPKGLSPTASVLVRIDRLTRERQKGAQTSVVRITGRA